MKTPRTVLELLRAADGLVMSDTDTVTFYVRFEGKPVCIAVGIGAAAMILHRRMEDAVERGQARRSDDPRFEELGEPWGGIPAPTGQAQCQTCGAELPEGWAPRACADCLIDANHRPGGGP